ncbi:MAG: superfamily II DNA/RNA helicase, partial [Candidatus Azotimanducaceae bacterium]
MIDTKMTSLPTEKEQSDENARVAASAEPINDFLELDLPKELYQAIDKLGFTTSTPIQKAVLPF